MKVLHHPEEVTDGRRRNMKGSIPSGSSTPNQTTSSKGADVPSIVNTQAVPSRLLNSPSVSKSSTSNQTPSSKGADAPRIVNTQAVTSRVLDSPPVVLQATTHAGTSGSNQRKRTRANTQAELAVAERASLNTVRRCDSAVTKRRRSTSRHTNGEGSSSDASG
ncbi:hypothetical protein Tco_0359821, partial [Tanacetum coccineum]